LRILLRTARLLLCQPVAQDADALFAFMGNAQAMPYTHAQPSREACEHHLMAHEAQRSSKRHVPWTLRHAQTETIIGWGGLYEDPFDPGWGMEAAYFFAPQVWGQGLATELVAACTVIADAAGTPVLQAFAHPDNAPSQKVLAKNGFQNVEWIAAMHRCRFERAAQTPKP
jgi:[ribosomal protein S5]-alanine N-acetyltransferase